MRSARRRGPETRLGAAIRERHDVRSERDHMCHAIAPPRDPPARLGRGAWTRGDARHDDLLGHDHELRRATERGGARDHGWSTGALVGIAQQARVHLRSGFVDDEAGDMTGRRAQVRHQRFGRTVGEAGAATECHRHQQRARQASAFDAVPPACRFAPLGQFQRPSRVSMTVRAPRQVTCAACSAMAVNLRRRPSRARLWRTQAAEP